MPKINNLGAITNALDMALEKHDEVVIFGEDVGFEGGVFRATAGLQKKYGKKRLFDAQIAEASCTGAAIGMAINGMRPVYEIQFEGFSYASLQHLFCHAARYRNRSRGRFTLPMVVRMPMGGGIRALEHHSEAIEAILCHIPGLQVIIPSSPFDTKGLLLAAIESNDPVIFIEPTKIYRAYKQEVPDDYYTIPIGQGYKIQEGIDITVVTYGAQVLTCQKVITQLKESNPKISIELIDLRTISPWDQELICESVKKTGRLMVVHEAVKSFSVSAEIIATVQEKCFEYLKTPSMRITGYDITIPFAKGEKYFLVTPDRIINGIEKMMNFVF